MNVVKTAKKCFGAIILSAVVMFGNCSKNEPPPEFDKELLLELINTHRKTGCKCGEDNFAPTTPVKWNTALERAARAHSEDMFTNNFFSHTGSDGSSVGARLERHNYKWKNYGENIARGAHTEKSVIDAWIKSAGHCRNIMNRNFTDVGASKKGNYWTLILATQ